MDITLIVKVAGVGMLVSVAAQILSKSGRDEQAMLVTIAGLVVVLLMLVREIGTLLDTVKTVFGMRWAWTASSFVPPLFSVP